MAVPDYAPCLFDSEEVGAIVINSVAGSVVQAIKACAVTGFNLRAISQIVVMDEVAVATAADHGYTATAGKLLLIDGAPAAGLNGRVQPTAVTANTFTFDAPGVPDGTYNGTMSAKRAPLGWTVVAENAEGTKAIFGRTDPQATASQLLVDDTKSTNSLVAVVAMVEGATDVDTFSARYPSSGYPYWLRGNNDVNPKKWVIAGDSKRMFFMCQKAIGAYPVGNFFGDPIGLYPGDAGGCVLTTHNSSGTSGGGGLTSATLRDFVPGANLNTDVVFHRALVDSALGAPAALCGQGSFGSAGMTSASAVVPIIGDYYIKTATEVRARLPALYLPQAVTPFGDRDVVYSPAIGRKLVAINVVISTTGVGQIMLDMTGPWDS